MTNKTVSLSVRVSDDDAAFLAGLEVTGAVTPSEKLRAILAAARRREEGLGSYSESLALFQEMLGPAVRALRDHELSTHSRSELLHFLSEWLPEAMAFFASALHTSDDEKGNDSWSEVERGLAIRTFALVQTVLRMGVTRQSISYDPEVISRRLEPVLELTEVLLKLRNDG